MRTAETCVKAGLLCRKQYRLAMSRVLVGVSRVTTELAVAIRVHLLRIASR